MGVGITHKFVSWCYFCLRFWLSYCFFNLQFEKKCSKPEISSIACMCSAIAWSCNLYFVNKRDLFAVNIHRCASKCWISSIQKKDLSNQTGILKQIRHHHCLFPFILSWNWITNHTYKNYTLFICVFLLTMGYKYHVWLFDDPNNLQDDTSNH